MRQSNKFKKEISEVNRVIHTATAWGDPKRAKEVNIDAVKNLLNLLNPSNIKQIIYFSTASVLDRNLNLLPEAFTYGTEYIQTKAQHNNSLCRYKKIPSQSIRILLLKLRYSICH